jgi:hypothetical protein
MGKEGMREGLDDTKNCGTGEDEYCDGWVILTSATTGLSSSTGEDTSNFLIFFSGLNGDKDLEPRPSEA